MTNRQAKLCKEIIRYKKLGEVLRRNKDIDYLELQDILGPGNLDFSDSHIAISSARIAKHRFLSCQPLN